MILQGPQWNRLCPSNAMPHEIHQAKHIKSESKISRTGIDQCNAPAGIDQCNAPAAAWVDESTCPSRLTTEELLGDVRAISSSGISHFGNFSVFYPASDCDNAERRSMGVERISHESRCLTRSTRLLTTINHQRGTA